MRATVCIFSTVVVVGRSLLLDRSGLGVSREGSWRASLQSHLLDSWGFVLGMYGLLALTCKFVHKMLKFGDPDVWDSPVL